MGGGDGDDHAAAGRGGRGAGGGTADHTLAYVTRGLLHYPLAEGHARLRPGDECDGRLRLFRSRQWRWQRSASDLAGVSE